mmetsp:Transcript_1161/g.1893  ORF Transcript_1161/g.1893 Transcript_1161/m.1893 type:complete len:286 (-) Transcript_1161:713-1570(-)
MENAQGIAIGVGDDHKLARRVKRKVSRRLALRRHDFNKREVSVAIRIDSKHRNGIGKSIGYVQKLSVWPHLDFRTMSLANMSVWNGANRLFDLERNEVGGNSGSVGLYCRIEDFFSDLRVKMEEVHGGIQLVHNVCVLVGWMENHMSWPVTLFQEQGARMMYGSVVAIQYELMDALLSQIRHIIQGKLQRVFIFWRRNHAVCMAPPLSPLLMIDSLWLGFLHVSIPWPAMYIGNLHQLALWAQLHDRNRSIPIIHHQGVLAHSILVNITRGSSLCQQGGLQIQAS